MEGSDGLAGLVLLSSGTAACDALLNAIVVTK
jgi:hypothetical protein